MGLRGLVVLVLACGAVPVVADTARAADPVRGQQLYESRCGACHSLDDNRVGPAHRGVYGRHAGRAKDYEYSTAVAKSKVVWTEVTLDQWLRNPEKQIPGQKMGYSVLDAQDRADVIAYLKLATAATAAQ